MTVEQAHQPAAKAHKDFQDERHDEFDDPDVGGEA